MLLAYDVYASNLDEIRSGQKTVPSEKTRFPPNQNVSWECGIFDKTLIFTFENIPNHAGIFQDYNILLFENYGNEIFWLYQKRHFSIRFFFSILESTFFRIQVLMNTELDMLEFPLWYISHCLTSCHNNVDIVLQSNTFRRNREKNVVN